MNNNRIFTVTAELRVNQQLLVRWLKVYESLEWLMHRISFELYRNGQVDPFVLKCVRKRYSVV